MDMNAKQGKPLDVFDSIDPKDGYHVHIVEFATLLSLYATHYEQGQRVDREVEDGTLLIRECENPVGKDHGEFKRLYLVLDSVARYLTTGGSWEELIGAMQSMKKIAPGGYVFPGYHLSDSYSCDGGEYQHVFVKDGTKEAVVWEEAGSGENGGVVGGWFDRTDLVTMAETLDENTVKRRPIVADDEAEADADEGDVSD